MIGCDKDKVSFTFLVNGIGGRLKNKTGPLSVFLYHQSSKE
jgi:hypothetical protein